MGIGEAAAIVMIALAFVILGIVLGKLDQWHYMKEIEKERLAGVKDGDQNYRK